MLKIRHYLPGEEQILRSLFYATVTNINIRDYSTAQVQAWSSERFDRQQWCRRIKKMNPFVVISQNEIVAYANLQKNGYIDHFFCHYLHQKKGIGKTLMRFLLRTGNELGIKHFHAQVSITARPFFEYFGFSVVKEQHVRLNEQSLICYLMEKGVK